MKRMNIAVGTRIKQYEIVYRLGAGGMGEVYLAEDTQLRRKVAIKFLPAESISDERAKSRLLKEARAAAALDHPNVCAIHEIGESGDCCFIVLQYIEGETLGSRLKRNPPDLRNSLAIAAQVADALADAHKQGIIHRDIKPDNVMIAANNQVKVLDFGLAKVIRDGDLDRSEAETETQLSVAGMIMGTVPYMSPEQVRGEELDCRSDIFSFGILFYELLCRRRPFDAKSKAEVISAILTQEPKPFQDSSSARCPKLEWLVHKCLEKDAGRRYQTMGDLIIDLEQIRRESDSELPLITKVDAQSTTQPLRWRKLLTSKPTLFLIFIAIAAAAALYAFFIGTPTSKSLPAVKSVNSPAYDHYIRGKVKVSSENREDNDGAIELLERAVAEDPGYAPAYAELARAYNVKAFYFASNTQMKQLNEDAEVAIHKALALDPNLAEAHYARGLILWTHAKGFPHEMAIQSFKRALALNPNLDEAHAWLATVYLHIGLVDNARTESEKALAINPDNTRARLRLGVIDLYAGKYEDALHFLKSVPRDANPSVRDRAIATTLFQLGRLEESAAVTADFLKTFPADEGGAMTSMHAMLLAKAGKQLEAEDAIRRAIEIGRGFGHFHHTTYNIASAYALLNKPEEAVKWLQVTADDGFPCYPLFVNDANLNSLRKDERFIAFMTKSKQQWERYKASL